MIPPPVHSPSKLRRYWWVFTLAAFLILASVGLPAFYAGGQRTNDQLDAATARAKQELPAFIEALRHPTPTMRFFVRAGFGPSKAREILWVRDVSYVDGHFQGTLDQAPRLYAAAQKGDKVTVEVKDVFDWAIKDGKAMRGAYTEQIQNAGEVDH